MRFAIWLAKPKVQTWFNGAMTVLWLVMLPITLLFTSRFDTVLWVSFISAWALFATHLGAWIAALVNVKAERIDVDSQDAKAKREAADTKRDDILTIVENMEQAHGEIITEMRQLVRELHGGKAPPK